MASTRWPPARSNPARVVAYFIANKEEEMFAEDIALKFDVAVTSVGPMLKPWIDAELISKAVDSKRRTTFTAGPRILAGEAMPQAGAAGFKKWLADKGQPSAEGRPARAPLQDPSTIVIEDGIELPAALRVVDRRVDELFMKMQPGQSFKVLADSAKRYIQRAHKFGKGAGRKFALRTRPEDGAEFQRIFRVE